MTTAIPTMHITRTPSSLHVIKTRVLDVVSASALTPEQVPVIMSPRGVFRTCVYEITECGTFSLKNTACDTGIRCIVFGGERPKPKLDMTIPRAEFAAGVTCSPMWSSDGMMLPPSESSIVARTVQEATLAATFHSPYVTTTRMDSEGSGYVVSLRCPRNIWEVVSDKNDLHLARFARDVAATMCTSMAKRGYSIMEHATVRAFLEHNGITLSESASATDNTTASPLGMYMSIAITRFNMVRLIELGITMPLCMVVIAHAHWPSIQWKYPH